jgi:hypothetical protein
VSVLFNYRRFYQDLDAKRKQRNVSWNKLGARAGVAESSVHRFVRQFEDPEQYPETRGFNTEVLVSLAHWMGQYDLKRYLTDEDGKPLN